MRQREDITVTVEVECGNPEPDGIVTLLDTDTDTGRRYRIINAESHRPLDIKLTLEPVDDSLSQSTP